MIKYPERRRRFTEEEHENHLYTETLYADVTYIYNNGSKEHFCYPLTLPHFLKNWKKPRITDSAKRRLYQLFEQLITEADLSLGFEEWKEFEDEWGIIQNLPSKEQKRVVEMLAKNAISACIRPPPNLQHRFRTPKDSTEPSMDRVIRVRSWQEFKQQHKRLNQPENMN